MVAVQRNLSIFKNKIGVDMIHYFLFGGGEGISRLPVGAALFAIRMHIGEFQNQILAAGDEHFPHRPYLCCIQVLKHRVAETGIIGIASLHARMILVLKTGVKFVDKLFVPVHMPEFVPRKSTAKPVDKLLNFAANIYSQRKVVVNVSMLQSM